MGASIKNIKIKKDNRFSNKYRKALRPYGFLLPTILVLGLLMAVPIFMNIGYTFFDNVIMNKNPVFVGLNNYYEVLTDSTFKIALKNTLIYAITSVAGHLLLGLIFALMLNSKYLHRHIKSLFRVIYILPWVFTMAVTAVLWRLILNPNGVANYVLMNLGILHEKVEWLSNPQYALIVTICVNIWAGYPFHMVSILAALQGVSQDLYEASTVDGANSFKQLYCITLPQIKPVIISLMMLDFIWNVQQFVLVWMLTGGGPIHATEVLSTHTYKLAFSQYEFSLAATSSIIMLCISMVVGFFYVRYQKKGD